MRLGPISAGSAAITAQTRNMLTASVDTRRKHARFPGILNVQYSPSMKPSKKTKKAVPAELLVRYGAEQMRFKPSQFKMRRSILTIPTAWKFALMTEIAFEVNAPKRHAKRNGATLCRGIVLACRPQKGKKGHYEVDLVLTQVPRSHIEIFDEARPHLPLCLEISCSECRWNLAGLSGTRGDCQSIQKFKQHVSVSA